MIEKIITTVLIFTSSIITTACRTESVRGVLVAAFSDEEPMVATIEMPVQKAGKFQLHYALRKADTVCLLTGQIDEDAVPFLGGCEDVRGIGIISCDDARSLNLKWVMSSCEGGYGRSIQAGSSRFLFGFGQDKDNALDQLTKARKAN